MYPEVLEILYLVLGIHPTGQQDSWPPNLKLASATEHGVTDSPKAGAKIPSPPPMSGHLLNHPVLFHPDSNATF